MEQTFGNATPEREKEKSVIEELLEEMEYVHGREAFSRGCKILNSYGEEIL